MAVEVRDLINKLEGYQEHIEVYVQQKVKGDIKLVRCIGVYSQSPVNGKEKVVISII